MEKSVTAKGKLNFSFHVPWAESEVEKLSARALSYIGDSIFELGIRLRTLSFSSETARESHQTASAVVCASKQAEFFSSIINDVSPKEAELLKSWRNAKLPSRPRAGFDKVAYARSTAFEAWIGYLFLTGQSERLDKLIEWCMNGEKVNGNEPAEE
ncbi:MAG: ribonuclease III [Candidatus Riflebacteria bacterium]|nr:ribonuclease III [Candidatus Riflebacteria bacterium]